MGEGSPKMLLEEQLPQQFLYDLGLYLQTCAHIEMLACSIVLHVEEKQGLGPVLTKRLHELRKMPINELLPTLRAVSDHLQDEWRNGLVELCDWIEKVKLNRHIAAHGAFFDPRRDGSLRVLYTHVRKDHGKKVYFPEEAEVTRLLVGEFVADADRILRSLYGLDEAVRKGDAVKRHV